MSTTRPTHKNESDEGGTCPHGHHFCPRNNPDAAHPDALVCFDCFVVMQS